jgi:prepilin-type N-terminal cleavage/methylation domain-containing protein
MRSEEGFTLIELLMCVIIAGWLAAIAVPSYIAFRSRAYDATAKSNVSAIIQSIESYYVDHSTYVGITLAGLKATYNQAIDVTKYVMPAGDLTATSYCVQSSAGPSTMKKQGPSAAIASGTCP